jgi:hypothetical protein
MRLHLSLYMADVLYYICIHYCKYSLNSFGDNCKFKKPGSVL